MESARMKLVASVLQEMSPNGRAVFAAACRAGR